MNDDVVVLTCNENVILISCQYILYLFTVSFPPGNL